MTGFWRIMIVLSVIVVLSPNVMGIKCWNCRSNNDPKCADPFDNSTMPITDCVQEIGLPHLPGLRPMCRKIRQKVNGQWVISRGCTWKHADDYSTSCRSTSNGPNEITSFCETCETSDGCNGAGAIGKTLALLLAPLALLLFK